MKIIVLCMCLIVSSLLAFGQRNQLIYKKKNKSTQNKEVILQKDKANKSVDYIEVDMKKILLSDEFSIQFNEENYVVKKEKIKVRDINNYSFYGKNKEEEGSIIISVLNNDIQGTIVHKNKVYKIETLETGDYAIVELDHSKLAENCSNFNDENIKKEEKGNIIEPSIEGENKVDLQDAPISKSLPVHSCKIRVLVLYTPAAENSVSNIVNTTLLAIDETNQSFSNSNINYEVELVYIGKTSYTEAGISNDLDRFSSSSDGYMNEVHSLRTKYSADVCVLLNNDANYCGMAKAIQANASTAFCVVKAYNCATGYYSFGHEIGHLLGCRHDTYVDNTTTPFAYGHGYIPSSKSWRTIMAYGAGCSSCTRIQYWSNPSITYGGVSMGTSSTNNNAKVWNQESGRIMAFKQPYSNVTVSYNDISNSQYADVIAKQNISTSGTVNIESGSNVTMRAGTNIKLNTGFHAKSGSKFLTELESVANCGSSSKNLARIIIDSTYYDTSFVELERLPQSEITVFPNPANEIINIEYKLEVSNSVTIELVTFLGVTVKEIFSNQRLDKGFYKQEVSIKDLQPGIYFIIIWKGNNKYVEKLIISK